MPAPAVACFVHTAIAFAYLARCDSSAIGGLMRVVQATSVAADEELASVIKPAVLVAERSQHGRHLPRYSPSLREAAAKTGWIFAAF